MTAGVAEFGQLQRITLAGEKRRMMARPVSPVISETTSVNLTFICSRAFCRCWMCWPV